MKGFSEARLCLVVNVETVIVRSLMDVKVFQCFSNIELARFFIQNNFIKARHIFKLAFIRTFIRKWFHDLSSRRLSLEIVKRIAKHASLDFPYDTESCLIEISTTTG